jgi:hypothetical protein
MLTLLLHAFTAICRLSWRPECPLCRTDLIELSQLIAFQPADSCTEAAIRESFPDELADLEQASAEAEEAERAALPPAIKHRVTLQRSSLRKVRVTTPSEHDTLSSCYSCAALLKHSSAVCRVRCGGCDATNVVPRLAKCLYCPAQFFVRPGSFTIQCSDCSGAAIYNNI